MKPILACVIVLVACQSALAQCCCDHCGCQSNCQKVCRVVCEVKKVPKITYCCECEDICIPGRSCRCKVCDECGHHKIVYTPTCGEVITRKKPVRKETLEEKVTYKWVVETLCCNCAKRCAATDQATPPLDDREMAARIPTVSDNATALPVGFQSPTDEQPVAETEAGETSRFDLRRILRPWAGQK